MNNKIVIVGCPRSGTGYASKFFNIGHEKLNKNGISSWCLAFDNALYGPNLQKVKDYFKDNKIKIYHQVRNPLKTISSFDSISKISLNYLITNLNITTSSTKLEKYIQIWVLLNKKSELISEFTYKVEDIESTFPNIQIYKNKNYNTRKHSQFNIKDFKNIKNKKLYEEFKDLSCKYGYNLRF